MNQGFWRKSTSSHSKNETDSKEENDCEPKLAYTFLKDVFRINSNQSPEYLMENFTRVNAIHGHSGRGSAANFFVPKIGSTEILKRSFFFSGINDWNSLPLTIKSIRSEKSFKSSLKAYMAAMY